MLGGLCNARQAGLAQTGAHRTLESPNQVRLLPCSREGPSHKCEGPSRNFGAPPHKRAVPPDKRAGHQTTSRPPDKRAGHQTSAQCHQTSVQCPNAGTHSDCRHASLAWTPPHLAADAHGTYLGCWGVRQGPAIRGCTLHHLQNKALSLLGAGPCCEEDGCWWLHDAASAFTN